MVLIQRYLSLLLIIITLSGCSFYKYELARKGYGGGYVVRRAGLLIPEYTIDEEGSAPKDKKLAAERFKRRKGVVNYYYKAMGRIYDDALSHLSDIGKIITGPFRLPGAAIENHRYQHNKEYREKVDTKRQAEQAQLFKEKNELKKQLKEYIKRDIQLEKNSESILK